jgi:hypothetical protein
VLINVKKLSFKVDIDVPFDVSIVEAQWYIAHTLARNPKIFFGHINQEEVIVVEVTPLMRGE